MPLRIADNRSCASRISANSSALSGATVASAADPPESSLFENAQEFRLEDRRHIADLVQENRSTVRQLEEMTRAAMASPRPVPYGLVVKNGWKIRPSSPQSAKS
jgi:hypothetical protein